MSLDSPGRSSTFFYFDLIVILWRPLSGATAQFLSSTDGVKFFLTYASLTSVRNVTGTFTMHSRFV